MTTGQFTYLLAILTFVGGVPIAAAAIRAHYYDRDRPKGELLAIGVTVAWLSSAVLLVIAAASVTPWVRISLLTATPLLLIAGGFLQFDAAAGSHRLVVSRSLAGVALLAGFIGLIAST